MFLCYNIFFMKNNKIYEIGFLIDPDLSQQESENIFNKIKDILLKKEASVISEGEIVEIDLAYEITTKIKSKNKKFNQAFFSWVKFEIKTDKLNKVKEEIDKLKVQVFRYLIIKTVKDDSDTNKFGTIPKEKEEKEEKDNFIIKTEENYEDNLIKIKGINEDIAKVLIKNGISTFKELAEIKTGVLNDILIKASLSNCDSKIWFKQAELARDGKWQELKILQEEIEE